MNNYYNYNDLRKKALKTDNFEDKKALAEWIEDHDIGSWNGYFYDIGDGKLLFPVYQEINEDEFETVDYEIR